MATVASQNPSSLSKSEIAEKAQSLYDASIRAEVEVPDNIGKMVVIDIQTGNFKVDELGFDSASALRKANPNAQLFGIRIGYNVAASLGGIMERTVQS